jgi:acetylglutamate kinase
MDDVIAKAAVLIEALPYIQRFRGAMVVVKFGGSAMEERRHAEGILKDVAFMECVGMRPVVVHGGGKAISRGLKAEGIEPRFLKGLRVTCEKTIEVVERVLKREITPSIVAMLEAFGARAQAVPGDTVFRVKRKEEQDAATGNMLDWGFVGDPHEVDTAPIASCLAEGIIPIISPLGRGEDGHVHNVNADVAAAATAKALQARKLVFLSDVPGLLRDRDDDASVLSTVRLDDVEDLVERGVIDGGMLPKVNSGMEALRGGVGKVHMVDGRMPHSLLLEIFTDKGVGTEMTGVRES